MVVHVADRGELEQVAVVDLDLELFLEEHQQVESIKAVQLEIVDESRLGRDSVGTQLEFVDQDFIDSRDDTVDVHSTPRPVRF